MRPVAVITGAAGGIGSATCDRLEAGGWEIVALDKLPVSRPGAHQVDMADAPAVERVLSRLPRADALVNNAAMQLFKPMRDTSFEEWDAVAAVNLRGAFVCLRALHDQLVASQGAVVNVGSVHALATSQAIGSYAASKGGLSAFTRAAAVELAPLGVRVNAVLPGAIETKALRDGLTRSAGAEKTLIERTPLARIGTASDVAHAIAFLLDARRSGFITGQELVIDGGALARLSTE